MRKFLLSTLVLSSCTLVCFNSYAQRKCATYEHNQTLMQADPKFAQQQQDIEKITNRFIKSGGSSSLTNLVNLGTPIYAIPGIVRKKTSKRSFSSNDYVKFSSKGGDDAWDATQYLNLWVCNLGQGLLGYAQFPGGNAKTDGVVILYSAFGNTGVVNPPYDKGRTATHEIGHWLNLRHIWGDDNGACTGSDLVDDTPNQGNYNFGCPSFPHKSCSNGPNGDMFMNYMDYTDDACMYMFTNGQRDRSYAVLQPGGARYSVTQSGKCGGMLTKTSTYVLSSLATNNTAKIYPQPAVTYVMIELKSNWKGKTTVTILNEMGAVVSVKQVNADSKIFRLDVNALTNGFYYVRLNNNREVITQKIIVEH
jgi:hypothetical protein